ncbi:AraC-like DNA-binding protein [Motilibacter peucedani]|uniref:AraC-like DNA-binding protein n=1 Tax=Motilibacter peucedani TaxID=598650 RepID=A0A420XRI2_9ACTN|nr:AraC family transcriptional regulator [Motilibacter peucedani]RKS77513.1 AraC-like DNA-binding protein [Motilibacter peucedani]
MAPIRQLTYSPPADASAPVEVMSFSRLRELDRGATQRGDFHVLALVTGGAGSVALDFAGRGLGPGDALWVGPGVVHRWLDITSLEGALVLFTPTAPATPSARELTSVPGRAGCWPVRADALPLATAAVEHLQQECSSEDPGPEVLGCLLAVLLARLQPPVSLAPSGDELFRRFQAALERGFAGRHDAGSYARALGVAPRTLSRAALRATGRTAKDVIDERLVTEAKRLLAHDGLTAAQVTTRLGFPDASAFSAFFRREVGVPPGHWQSLNR